MTGKSKTPKTVYRVLSPYLAYRDTRAEQGDLVDDIPEGSVKWLLSDGCIEKVEED